jgi:hypothetical protein
VCRDGYTADSQSDDCEPCPSADAALGGSIGFTILLICVLLILFAVIWKSEGYTPLKADPFATVKAFLPEDRSPPQFTYNLKIVLAYLQIATALTSVVEMPLPSYFQTFSTDFTHTKHTQHTQ